MAALGVVYDATPVIRTPADILTDPQRPGESVPGPQARNKWLTASVTDDDAEVIGAVVTEAQRRDPDHQRCWVGLVDGNNHQIQTLTAQANDVGSHCTSSSTSSTPLEYLHQAARCFFPEDDHGAQDWVATHARRILAGHSSTVAAAIRREATTLGLTRPSAHPPTPARATY
jgi:hypothetical protein